MDKYKLTDMIFNIIGHSIFVVINLTFTGLIIIGGYIVFLFGIELLNSLDLRYYDEIEKVIKVRNFNLFLPEGGLTGLLTFEITKFPWNGMVFLYLFFYTLFWEYIFSEMMKRPPTYLYENLLSGSNNSDD